MTDLVLQTKLTADGDGFIGEIRLADDTLQSFQKELKQTDSVADRAGRSVESASDRMVRGMSASTIASNKMTAGMSRAGREAAEAARKQDRYNRELRESGSAAAVAAKGVGLLAAGYAAMRLGEVARGILDVNVRYDKLEASLKTVTGSQKAANREFEWLQKFAATTPFQLEEVVGAFIKLRALGLEPSERALRSYGNTASAMGKTINDMIEAVADASTGEFERLKEFGIKARTQGDEITFIFQGVRTTVQNNAEAIVSYLTKIGEVNFAGAMSEQMELLPGRISNMQDSISRLARTFGESSGFNNVVGTAADKVAELANNMVTAMENGEAWYVVLGKQEASIAAQIIARVSGLKGSYDLLNYLDLLPGDEGSSLSTIDTSKLPSRRSPPRPNPTTPGHSGPGPDAVSNFRDLAAKMQKQVDLYNATTRAAEVRYQIEKTGLADTNPKLAGRLVTLAEELDRKDALKKKTEEQTQAEKDLVDWVMETSDKVADRQKKEMQARDEALRKRVGSYSDALKTEVELENEHYQKILQDLERAEQEKIDIGMTYAEARQRAEQQHQAKLKEIRERASAEDLRAQERAAESRADLMMEPFKNAIRGIQDQFTSFYDKLFRGGIDSFKDLASGIKDIFLHMFAELASLATFRPLANAILQSFGMGQLAQQMGLSGGGGFGLSSLFQAGEGGGPYALSMAGTPWTGATEVTGLNGEVIGTIPGMRGSGLSGFLTKSRLPSGLPGNFGGASIGGLLGGAGAGFMGRSLAGSLFGSQGTGADVGGAVGGGIGFAVGGPIGAGIGSFLGSSIGGLFHNQDFPYGRAKIGIENGRAVIRNIDTLDGKSRAEIQQLGDAVVQQINAQLQAAGVLGSDSLKDIYRVTSVGTSAGRSDALPKGFFAGGEGSFAAGATYTGLQSADQAVSQAIQDAMSNIPQDVLNSQQITQQKDAFERQLKLMTSLTPELDRLNQQFDQMRRTAEELGTSTALVDRAYRRQLETLQEQAQGRLGSLVGQGRQVLGIDTLREFSGSLLTGDLSPLSSTDRLAAIRSRFAEAVSARESDRAVALGQQALSLGRDVFASGPQFQQLFTDINTSINSLLDTQEQRFANTFGVSLEVAVRETGQDQVSKLDEISKKYDAQQATLESIDRRLAAMEAA